MAIAVGDVVRFSYEARAEGQQVINTAHMLCGAVGSDTSEAAQFPAMAQVATDNWQSNLMSHLSIAYEMLQVTIQRVQPTISAAFIVGRNEAMSFQGEVTGDHCPLTVAAVISLKTGLPGRSRRGRSYLGPIAEGDTTGSFMDGTKVFNLRSSFLNAMLGMANGVFGSWTFGIFSKVLAEWNVVVPALCIGRTVLGNVRRRRIGRGK